MRLAWLTGVPVVTSSSVTTCVTGRSSNAAIASSSVPTGVDRLRWNWWPTASTGTPRASSRSTRPCSALLAGLLGVVVVDGQDHRAVGAVRGVDVVERLVRVREREVDELLAEDVVPLAAAQAVGLGVPSETTSLTTSKAMSGLVSLPNGPYVVAQRLGHVEDVVVQPGPQELLVGLARRERRAVVVLEEPGRGLAVPDERVAVDARVVVLGEVHDRLGLGVDPEVAARRTRPRASCGSRA